MIFTKTLVLHLLFFPLLVNAAVTVYISTYKEAKEGDPNHWAIFLEGNRRVILQLANRKDDNGYFVDAPVYDKSPTRARRHKKSYFIGKINNNNLFESAVDTIQSTPVDNDSTTWNCQAWAIEALDRVAHTGAFKWGEGQREMLMEMRQYWQ
ncbi:hypothetical protein CTRI78_v006618 [Colletotrichum trifolii]|uniref:Uncharacterized protein n=1 Tax=Colletotrichum trifolii TaxID=5466 RepID=A0A4R8RF99_COLTR|nr:hypothetical protein CTRI78_v006618 [Colletotrichum trifolii]